MLKAAEKRRFKTGRPNEYMNIWTIKIIKNPHMKSNKSILVKTLIK